MSSPLNVSWQTKPFDYYCTTKSNVTMSEMITKNHALIAEFGDSLDRLLDGIENFMANSRPTLGGERFLTDREVSARLKVSRRTLQDYRNNGIIAYYQLGGKILYKESDIERMLDANYREAFRRSDRLTEIPCKTVLPSNGVRDSLTRRLRVSHTPSEVCSISRSLST